MGQRFDRRGKRTDEMLDLMRALWQPGWTEFDGEFYQTPRLEMEPTPPHIPIYVGGLVRHRVAAGGPPRRLDRRPDHHRPSASHASERLRQLRAEYGLSMDDFTILTPLTDAFTSPTLRACGRRRHHRHHSTDAVDVLRRPAGVAGREGRRHEALPQGPAPGRLIGHTGGFAVTRWAVMPSLSIVSGAAPTGAGDEGGNHQNPGLARPQVRHHHRTGLHQVVVRTIIGDDRTGRHAGVDRECHTSRRRPARRVHGVTGVAGSQRLITTPGPQRGRPVPSAERLAVSPATEDAAASVRSGRPHGCRVLATPTRRRASTERAPAPVVANSRNAKQNRIASSPPLPPSR